MHMIHEGELRLEWGSILSHILTPSLCITVAFIHHSNCTPWAMTGRTSALELEAGLKVTVKCHTAQLQWLIALVF